MIVHEQIDVSISYVNNKAQHLLSVDHMPYTVLNALAKNQRNPQNNYFNCIISYYPIITPLYRDRN